MKIAQLVFFVYICQLLSLLAVVARGRGTWPGNWNRDYWMAVAGFVIVTWPYSIYILLYKLPSSLQRTGSN